MARTNVVSARFTDAEREWIDAERGRLSRDAYMRWLVLEAKRRSEDTSHWVDRI